MYPPLGKELQKEGEGINYMYGMLFFFLLHYSLLKIILLQSSEASDIVMETKPIDFISLSGVCLINNRGIWKIQARLKITHLI